MDIASLGIRVQTQGAKEASNDLDKLDASAKRVEQSTQKFGKEATVAAKSAKELQFATRNLPAQFTDIATALGSGQRPLQVLLQQGGQIKDMFGGVGPAIRAVGGYVAGLVNPFTLAAAAVAGLGVAMFKAEQQTADLDRALILSGNTANLTAAQLRDMAADLDKSTRATTGQATEVLAQVASTGRFTAEQIQLVAKAAINMQQATGQATEDTLKDFSRLADAPTDYILKINEAGKVNHFLTEETVRAIEQLETQGKTADAAALAYKAYADAINTRAPELERHLTSGAALFRDIKSAVLEAGDAVVQFFQKADTSVQAFLQRHEQAVQRIASIVRNLPIPGAGIVGFQIDSALKNAQANAQTQPAASARGFNFAAASGGRIVNSEEERKHIDEVKAAQNEWNSSIRLGETEAQRLKRELDEAAEAGKKLGKSGADIAAAQRAIRERFAAGARTGGGRVRTPRAAREIDFTKGATEELQRQAEAEDRATQSFLDMQAALDGPLAQAEREHAKRVAELNQLAAQSPIAAAGLKDALEAEAKAHQKNVEAIQAELNPLGALLDDMQFELQMIGKSNAERAVMIELRRNHIDVMSREAQAALATANAFDAEAKAKQTSIDLMDDFRRGASDALADFVTGAKSAKDALKDFFNELAAQITHAIAQNWMEKLFGQQGQSGGGSYGGLLQGLFGLFTGGSGGGEQWYANGGAFENGVQKFAYGGVVGSPTNFLMSGGRLGLMGEAGPEAILPLHRGPDGKLGVRMEAANDAPAYRGPAVVNQAIYVQGRMDSRTPTHLAQASAREQNRAARRNS